MCVRLLEPSLRKNQCRLAVSFFSSWSHPEERANDGEEEGSEFRLASFTNPKYSIDIKEKFEEEKGLKDETVLKIVTSLLDNGVVQIDNAIRSEELEVLSAAAADNMERVRLALDRRKETETSEEGKRALEEGFREVKIGDGCRLESIHDMRRDPFLSLIQHDGWAPVVQNTLQSSVHVAFMGVTSVLPSAKTEPPEEWHSLVPHLFGDRGLHLPPHSLEVIVPLSPVDLFSGPWEFRLGSHVEKPRGRDGGEVKDVPFFPSRGSVLIADSRVQRRGIPNRGGRQRLEVFVSYGKRWFRDSSRNDQSKPALF